MASCRAASMATRPSRASRIAVPLAPLPGDAAAMVKQLMQVPCNTKKCTAGISRMKRSIYMIPGNQAKAGARDAKGSQARTYASSRARHHDGR